MLEPETFRNLWEKRGLMPRMPAVPERNTWLAFRRPVYTPIRFLLVLAFSALWMADLGLIMRMGVDYESHPIARWMIETTGWFGFSSFKLAALVFLLYLSPYMRTWIIATATIGMLWPVGVSVLIVSTIL